MDSVSKAVISRTALTRGAASMLLVYPSPALNPALGFNAATPASFIDAQYTIRSIRSRLTAAELEEGQEWAFSSPLGTKNGRSDCGRLDCAVLYALEMARYCAAPYCR